MVDFVFGHFEMQMAPGRTGRRTGDNSGNPIPYRHPTNFGFGTFTGDNGFDGVKFGFGFRKELLK